MRLAACVLIEREDGKILCVSRSDDLENWNLPGGKREDGEPASGNAVRELFEETGISLWDSDLEWIYARHDDEFWVDVYRFREQVRDIKFRDSSEGTVAWKDWSDLLSEKSSFSKFNLELFVRLASA